MPYSHRATFFIRRSTMGTKKILLFFFCAALIFAFVSFSACGKTQSDPSQDNGTEGLQFYPLDGDQYAVAAGEAIYLSEIVIPSKHNGKPVTAIADNGFQSCANLTKVTIPSSVTSIGELAFYCCGKLTSITIPNGVTSIGYMAFLTCSSLTSVTIPNSVTSIGGVAFGVCSSLTSITIPSSVTNIESSTFSGCSSLMSITIPSSVTSIGYFAFSGCINLTSINFSGTTAQWNAISKGSAWADSVPSACKVYCTNGTLNV